MKQCLAIIAAVALLTLPIMVSAGEETVIPPEANWSPTPPTPAHLMVPQERVASTAQEQANDAPRRLPAALMDQDARYKAVNATLHDD